MATLSVSERSPSPLAKGARYLVSVGFFPALLVLCIGATILAFASGWPPIPVVAVVTLCAAAVVLLAERLQPYRGAWNQDHGDVSADLWHMIVSGVFFNWVYRTVIAILLLPAAVYLSELWGGALWPTHWPLLARLALALLLADFGYYWAHRLGHQTNFLWRLHSTHHSSERLWGINTFRDHPLGLLLLDSGFFVPLMLLGCDELTFTLALVFTTVHSLLDHCNIDLRLGPFNWIFSTPALHRWHHAAALDESHHLHNYGANLIVWDIIFGTRFLPHREQVSQVGIGDMPHFPRSYWGQLKVPFVWKRLVAGHDAVDARP